jgi:hypothetical protein
MIIAAIPPLLRSRSWAKADLRAAERDDRQAGRYLSIALD